MAMAHSLINTNIMIPHLFHLEKWFAMYFELAVSTSKYNFIAQISTCDQLMSKFFVSKFCLGDLSLCGCTVNTVLKEVKHTSQIALQVSNKLLTLRVSNNKFLYCNLVFLMMGVRFFYCNQLRTINSAELPSSLIASHRTTYGMY